MNESILIGLGIWNLTVFIMYGIDKWLAVKNMWRISEKTLITAAFLMGAVGASLGMCTFRHKTRKRKFRRYIELAVLVNLGIFAYIERM